MISSFPNGTKLSYQPASLVRTNSKDLTEKLFVSVSKDLWVRSEVKVATFQSHAPVICGFYVNY